MACLLYWLKKCVSHISQKKLYHLTYQNLVVTHRGLEYYHFNFALKLLFPFFSGAFFWNCFHACSAAFLHPFSFFFLFVISLRSQCWFVLQSLIKDLTHSSWSIEFLPICNIIYRCLYTIHVYI